MIRPTDSIRSVRAAFSRLGAFVVFGLAAGLVLFLVETVDRLVVLNAGIDGVAEAVGLTLLLGSTVLGGGVLGLLLGLVATALEFVRQAVAALFPRYVDGLPPMALDAASLVAGALLVTIVLKTVSGMFPTGLEL